jgi:hypothetical protein
LPNEIYLFIVLRRAVWIGLTNKSCSKVEKRRNRLRRLFGTM